MPRALDFTRQFALTTRAVAGLASRFDFAALVDIAREHIKVFVVEATAFWAIGGSAAPTASAPSAGRSAASPGAALLRGSGSTAGRSVIRVFAHESGSPFKS